MKTLVMSLSLLMYLALHFTGAVGKPDAFAFSSDQATLMEFIFNGELFASSVWNATQTIDDQLLYTIGHLNGDRAVGRVHAVTISNVNTTKVSSGVRIRYRAVLQVAWGTKSNLPTSYTFRLPRRVDFAGLVAFAKRYNGVCVDWGAHDVDYNSMWYYYRPKMAGCVLRAEDIVIIPATVRVAKQNSAGKYPEYHHVWNDNALDVVAIFGKYEEGASTSADAGIAAYNQFVASVRLALGPGTTSVPADVPSSPGVGHPDVALTKSDAGKRITVTALLVDNVSASGTPFDTRYAALSGGADLIVYSGHAGLGRNIRALAHKGTFVAGKYQILFMNATDSFAHVDDTLAERRAALNSDDVAGTKYMDIVTNAMPAYFASMPSASLALIRGLMASNEPKTYDEILRSVDSNQVAVVTGEDDNVYQPDPDELPTTNWTGMTEAASVLRNEERVFETPLLSGGPYTFTMTHDPAHPGGDVDLYVRIGERPTTLMYDCRPYRNGSNEECVVQLAAGSSQRIFVMLRGYANQPSYFLFTGRR